MTVFINFAGLGNLAERLKVTIANTRKRRCVVSSLLRSNSAAMDPQHKLSCLALFKIRNMTFYDQALASKRNRHFVHVFFATLLPPCPIVASDGQRNAKKQ